VAPVLLLGCSVSVALPFLVVVLPFASVEHEVGTLASRVLLPFVSVEHEVGTLASLPAVSLVLHLLFPFAPLSYPPFWLKAGTDRHRKRGLSLKLRNNLLDSIVKYTGVKHKRSTKRGESVTAQSHNLPGK
jgi:hypothetical protein